MSKKADDFERLAIKRMPNALKQLELIGNLSRPQYECTKEQADKIILTLRNAVAEIETKFNRRLNKGFSFDDPSFEEEGFVDVSDAEAENFTVEESKSKISDIEEIS